MFELPQAHSVLGSCQVPLASLLEGEIEVETECVCEGEETGDSDKKDGGSGAKSDISERKKTNKGQ